MSSISQKIIEEVKVIPPLSRTASDLIVVLENPDHTVEEVVHVVSSDPMLVGQLLKIANCAAFARRSPVESIGGAVSYLGDKMVIGIALGASAARLYDAPLKGYDAEAGMLWSHCLLTALAAREISKFTDGKVRGGVAYTAGLLHDIGKAILSIHLEDRLKKVFDLINNDSYDFLSAEKAVVGVDHCEIGALLGKHWGLPKSIREVIAHHHQPAEAAQEHQVLTYVVHLADTVAMMSGVGTGVDSMRYSFVPDYEKFISLDRDDLDRLLLMISIEADKVGRALNEAE